MPDPERKCETCKYATWDTEGLKCYRYPAPAFVGQFGAVLERPIHPADDWCYEWKESWESVQAKGAAGDMTTNARP